MSSRSPSPARSRCRRLSRAGLPVTPSPATTSSIRAAERGQSVAPGGLCTKSHVEDIVGAGFSRGGRTSSASQEKASYGRPPRLKPAHTNHLGPEHFRSLCAKPHRNDRHDSLCQRLNAPGRNNDVSSSPNTYIIVTRLDADRGPLTTSN